MAPLPPCAELELLAEIEDGWRDALSLVLAGEAGPAAAAVERAGAALARLPPPEVTRARLDEEALVAYAARTERLMALHAQLLAASGRERDELGRELAGLDRNRATLHAYAAQVPESTRHSCDAVA